MSGMDICCRWWDAGRRGHGERDPGELGSGEAWALPPWEAEPAFAAIATKCQGFTPGSTRTFYGVDCGETLWRTSLHITGLSDFPMLAHSTSERLATRELELSTPQHQRGVRACGSGIPAQQPGN